MARDYSNGKIYLIRNHVNNLVYVGSTVRALSARMAQHRSVCKTKPNLKLYKAFDLIGVDQFYIDLLQEYPCKNKEELLSRENFYIRELDAVNDGYNGKFALRTMHEYRQDNRDILQEKKHEYYEQNKNAILQKKHEYYIENSDAILKYGREYRNKNSDELREKAREYVIENFDRISIRRHEYYEKNKVAIREKQLEYYKKNSEKLKMYQRELRANARSNQ